VLLLSVSSRRFADGGIPKTTSVCGPVNFQRPAGWDLLWSPARSSLKAVPNVKAGLGSAWDIHGVSMG